MTVARGLCGRVLSVNPARLISAGQALYERATAACACLWGQLAGELSRIAASVQVRHAKMLGHPLLVREQPFVEGSMVLGTAYGPP